MNWKQNDKGMEKQEIVQLLDRYNSGQASAKDLQTIEELIENGLIEPEDLQDIRVLADTLQRFEYPEPSPDLNARFYQMLAREKKSARGFSFGNWFTFSAFAPGLAVAAVTFLLGLALGYALFRNDAVNPEQMSALSSEVKDLKEMMMLSLLEKESATDRLKAVSLSQEMANAGKPVTRALLATLNNDENVNVRLAALEALIPYTGNSEIRTELIRSISAQHSPLVQIALADLMAALQEKSSVSEFEKLLNSDRTPEEIKKRIREKIEVII